MSLGEALRETKEALADEDPNVKTAVLTEVIQANIPTPTNPKVVAALWVIFISTLSVILLAALGGIIYVVIDAKKGTTPDVIVTIFTSALTGLIGLFVRSPASSA